MLLQGTHTGSRSISPEQSLIQWSVFEEGVRCRRLTGIVDSHYRRLYLLVISAMAELAPLVNLKGTHCPTYAVLLLELWC